MLIDKRDKGCITQSGKPFENWIKDDENYFLVEDGSELANKAESLSPYFDFVLDVEGNLIDITPTERPSQPPQPPTSEERLQALEDALLMLTLGGM